MYSLLFLEKANKPYLISGLEKKALFVYNRYYLFYTKFYVFSMYKMSIGKCIVS